MTAARRASLIAAIGLAGCRSGPPVERLPPPAVGVSLALYREGESSYGVVDDRRWVEVTGSLLVLDDVDPAAALPSLVIEPLGATDLEVGQCAREHVTAAPDAKPARPRDADEQVPRRYRLLDGTEPEVEPAVTPLVVSSLRCQVTGARGRHLVRVLYVSPGLGYRAQHDVTMAAGDRATIATRFALETPRWSVAADVTLFHGLPGGERAPAQLARGSIQLDGSTAVLAVAAREVPARLVRIYDGAIRVGRGSEADAQWARDSVRAVWVWLELAERELPPGPVHAHLEVAGEAVRDVHVPAGGRELVGATLRLPLWIDEALTGMRSRVVLGADGASLADRFVISVANTGEVAREVWIEERLRASRRRTLRGGWPTRPALVHGRARTPLVIKPGATERAGYVIEYVF